MPYILAPTCRWRGAWGGGGGGEVWVWVGKWREDWEEAEDMEAVEGLGPGGGGGALR